MVIMKTMGRLTGYGLFYLCAALLICSCASTPPEAKLRYFWPPPPEEPKIEWIGNYSSKQDFGPRSLFSKFVGEDAEIQLKRPMTATGDGNGKVYVADADSASIFVFDFNKQDVHGLGGDSLDGVMKIANGVALDGKDNVYAADSSDQKIYVIDPISNRLIKTLDISKHAMSIGRLAIDAGRGHIVMPDIKGNQIVVTDLEGKLLFKFGKKGVGDGEFNVPHAVAVEKDGGIVVCDTFNARIQRFTPEGKFINKFGERGDSGGAFSLIKGVAVDSEGHIYITDSKESRVLIYSPQGDYLLSLGGKHSSALANIAVGGFLVPQGISIDKNDRIYIADQLNSRFQVYQYINPRYLAQFPVLPGQAAKPPQPAALTVK